MILLRWTSFTTYLVEAHIPHTYEDLFDSRQIRMYVDEEMENELDDAIIHSGSHGH